MEKGELVETVVEEADREREPGRTMRVLESEREEEAGSWTEMEREPVELKVTEKEWEPLSEGEKE